MTFVFSRNLNYEKYSYYFQLIIVSLLQAERMLKYLESNITSETTFGNSCKNLYNQITHYLNNAKEYDRKVAKVRILLFIFITSILL